MHLRLLWTPNPPREPFTWEPRTVGEARLALRVLADLESFIDSEPMAGKVTASWGSVEATGPSGWVDVEAVVPDWTEPDLGTPPDLASDAAVGVAQAVVSGYARYLSDQAIIAAGRVGLANRYIEARTHRSSAP